MAKKKSDPKDSAEAESSLRQPVPRSLSDGGGAGGQAAQELRRQAEEIARGKAARMPENLDVLSPEAARQLLHQLRVHQIELEMQNEELRRTQAELEALRVKYFDLYDLAPVGYCVISEQGLILESNLTAGTMLGEERRALAKKPITRFILPEDQDIYYRHRKSLFETGAPQICELRMMRKDGGPFWAQIEATAAQAADGEPICRAVISDISGRKQAEETLRESETSLQAVLQSTADGILAVNRENQVLFANDRFIQMWRIPPPVMAGKDDAVLLQHVLDQLVDPQGFLQQVRELYKSEAESFDTLYFKDGRVFERLSRPLMRAAMLDGRVWSFRDVTEKKLAEKEIINLNRLYAMLSQTNQSIVRMQTRDELFKEACRVAIDYGKFCLVWIGLYSSDQDKIIPYSWAGKEIGFFENELSNTPRELIDSLPWIRAFHENQTVVINDVAVDPNCEYWRELARQRGFHSLAAIPLFLNDIPIGVFVFYSSEANFFVEKEINLLREVGIDLSFALNRFDIEIKRKRAEEALRESETRFRIALENSPIVVFNQDRELRYTWIHNPHPGFDPRAMLGKTDAELLPADDAARLTEIKRRVLENGVTAREEVKTTIGGQAFFYDLTVEPLRDLKEKIIGVTCASLDITDRHKAEEVIQASLREKEVLLREIHHRVKNNMQVVSSLFNLQTGHIKDEDARRMLKEGQLRIRSMALVHEKLYRSRDLSKIDFADYLRSLADHLYQFFQVRAGRIRLETDLEQIHLDVNAAVPCGLLASELISNALKHAFPEGREGAVELGLRRKKDGAVELRVADDGVGLPDSMDFRHTESFGLQVVILLVGQLNGTIEFDRKKGAAFTIIFPEEKAGQGHEPEPRRPI